jgi:peptidoglycan/LPS O-acetylase OafA/YrhL
MKRIQSLDGLRAVAIIMVITSHYLPQFLSASPAHYVKMLGAPGVDVFFVISGFLITTLMLREWDKTGRVSLTGFYLRRSLRILPAYFFFLLFVFIFVSLGKLPFDNRAWGYLLTYTYNFSHNLRFDSIGQIWSLCVEEHF